MAYPSKDDIISKLKLCLNDSPETLYQCDFINYKSYVIGERVQYTEIAAEEILRNCNIEKLKSIHNIDRTQSYDMGHDGSKCAMKCNDRSNKSEKMLAKDLFNQCKNTPFDIIGEIFDYEVPLAADLNENRAGDIDLVSKIDKFVYLLELKKENSKETLLRCILEIYTYYKQLQHEKFIENFKLEKLTKIKPAILVFKDGIAHEQYKDKQGNQNTLALMKELGVALFLLKKLGESSYEVINP